MKQATNTLVYVNLGSEMLYILNNRIKALDIEDTKRMSILCQIAQNLYNSEENDKLLRDCPTSLSLDSIYNLLHKICHKSVITLDSVSFAKMIEMIVMALKKDTLLMKNDFGLYHVTVNHLSCIDNLLKRKDLTLNIRQKVSEIMSGLKPYDFYLIKKDIINLLVFKHSKISIYLKDNVQANDGHFAVKPPKACGFNCVRTGTVGNDGLPDSLIGVNPFLASSRFKVLHHYTDEENDKLGYNLFENLKKNELVIVDKEYLSRINTDMSQKILGTQNDGVKEMIELELDFDEGDTMAHEPSQSKSKMEMSIFDKPNQGKKATGKVMGMLDDEDDDLDSKPVKQAPKKEAFSGNDLLNMMDDL